MEDTKGISTRYATNAPTGSDIPDRNEYQNTSYGCRRPCCEPWSRSRCLIFPPGLNTAARPSEAVPGKRMLRTCRHKHDKTLPRSLQERFLAFAASSSFGTARRKYHAQGHRNQNVGHGLSDRMYRTYTNGTGNDDHCRYRRNAAFRRKRNGRTPCRPGPVLSAIRHFMLPEHFRKRYAAAGRTVTATGRTSSSCSGYECGLSAGYTRTVGTEAGRQKHGTLRQSSSTNSYCRLPIPIRSAYSSVCIP